MFWIDGGHKRIFGYPVENALIPQSFWESLIHPEDRTRVLAGLKVVMENSTPEWGVEYRFRKTDDTYAWVHDRRHILFEDGQASRMIGTRDCKGYALKVAPFRQ